VSRRILYLQFTNPAAYPPLLHSSMMLAERGWEVLFAGAPADGAASFALPAHQSIRYIEAAAPAGRSAAVRYAAFGARCLRAAARFRPHWCYASDALSAPVALAVSAVLGARLLYHEHDAPAAGSLRPTFRQARERIARQADVVVAPSAQRLAQLPDGRGQRMVVWNCPRRCEVWTGHTNSTDGRFRLVYHGSLSRDRLTPHFVAALRMLPAEVELDIYGYETAGHRGYIAELLQRAEQAGLTERVRYHGAIADRRELLQRLRGHQLGIATVVTGSDANLDTLAGASNKAFEYLALGIPLLISRDEAWQRMFGAPGYAIDCEPADAASIATAVRSVLDHPARAREMRELGQARIVNEWNYETQFAPVLELLSA
jgi:glycosyltransferase involved in cell wall biosynthesis